VALDTKLANAQRSRAADAVTVRCNAGKLRLYDGTRPATPDTAIGAQVLLTELTFGNPAFGAAVDGVATANAITADALANATGTATWSRWVESDGSTAVLDCEVGTSGANVNLNTVAIVAGATVSITSLTYTQPQNGA